MSARPCEVRGVRRDQDGQASDLENHGHVIHECTLDRPGSLMRHAGDHQCACGCTFATNPEEDDRSLAELAAEVGLPVEAFEDADRTGFSEEWRA